MGWPVWLGKGGGGGISPLFCSIMRKFPQVGEQPPEIPSSVRAPPPPLLSSTLPSPPTSGHPLFPPQPSGPLIALSRPTYRKEEPVSRVILTVLLSFIIQFMNNISLFRILFRLAIPWNELKV